MRLLAGSLSLVALMGVNAVLASDFGSAEEAETMLQAAIEAMKSDRDAALEAFNAGDPPFRDKDLYVFCGEDGIITAHGANIDLIGQNSLPWKDKNGKAFVEEMFASANEDQIVSVDYLWPRPGEEEASQKSSFVTMVSGQMCGVGYYK